METCPKCNKLFEKKVWNQKYCCMKRDRRKKYNCGHCGKETIRLNKGSKVKFCSMICANLHKGRTSERKCRQCSKRFTIKTSALKYGYGEFCSNECHNESMKKDNYCMCPNCGDIFNTGTNDIDRRIYCKKECFYESMMIGIPKDELYEKYINERMTTRELAIIFNTDKKVICDYLHRYGIEVRPDTFPDASKIRCKNGLMVRSNYERAFINALLTFGIDFEYEPRLPFDKRYAADMLVGDVYVEIWGMMDWEDYRIRKERKVELYEKNNVKLFSVYPDDFRDVYGKINELKRLIS